MQISFIKQGTFKLKTKLATIITGKEIKIGDFVISSPGEYEISQIEVEVIDGITLLHADELDLAYLSKRKKPLDDKEVERISEVDILFVPVGGGEVFTAKEALGTINQIEPKIVIPMYYDDISEFARQEGIQIQKLDSLKLVKKDIDEEQRKIIVLNESNK